MFYLPNDIAIDIEGAIEGMLDENQGNYYVLDLKTGDVGCLNKESCKKPDEKRYFEISKVSEADKKKWMKEFITKLVNFEDEKFGKRLLAILDKNGLKNAMDILEQDKEKGGWIHGWAQWERDETFEIFENWLSILPVNIKNEFKGCDDCAICQAMKSGATGDELIKAFEEQNKKNDKR